MMGDVMANQTSDEHRDTAGLDQAPQRVQSVMLAGLVSSGEQRTKNGNR